MSRKKPTIQYTCPCGKELLGYTKTQVWFQYVMHLESENHSYKCPGERGELLKECQKKLGISDLELQTPRLKR